MTIGELAGLPGARWVSFVVREGQLVPAPPARLRLRLRDDLLDSADMREQLVRAFDEPALW